MYCEDILYHTSNGPFRRIRQLWKSAPNYLQRKNPAAEATGKGSEEGFIGSQSKPAVPRRRSHRRAARHRAR
jgi:hypothetical protein